MTHGPIPPPAPATGASRYGYGFAGLGSQEVRFPNFPTHWSTQLFGAPEMIQSRINWICELRQGPAPGQRQHSDHGVRRRPGHRGDPLQRDRVGVRQPASRWRQGRAGRDALRSDPYPGGFSSWMDPLTRGRCPHSRRVDNGTRKFFLFNCALADETDSEMADVPKPCSH